MLRKIQYSDKSLKLAYHSLFALSSALMTNNSLTNSILKDKNHIKTEKNSTPHFS